jgi:hypothetical protein
MPHTKTDTMKNHQLLVESAHLIRAELPVWAHHVWLAPWLNAMPSKVEEDKGSRFYGLTEPVDGLNKVLFLRWLSTSPVLIRETVQLKTCCL